MKFKNCGNTPLGLYPVVDDYKKLLPLYELGVTTAQLRIKNKEIEEIEEEIIKAIEVSNKFKVRLFINDYWELAIKYKAYGIHLGQEDIQEANIDAIYKASIRLGISTHTTAEIEIALGIEPSYVAIGPIFETTSKKMVYKPVGLEDLERWAKSVDYPIVAIAGIDINNIKAVLETNLADGIAMIGGVLSDNKVDKSKVKALLKCFE
ncbi:MAG: thiamine phosphate synthase [Sulfurovum sp.]